MGSRVPPAGTLVEVPGYQHHDNFMEQDITPESLGGDAHMTASPDEGTVSGVEALSLEELNSALGKTYSNKEAALKSLKDTFAFVGKRKEDVVSELAAKQAEALSKADSVVEKVSRLERELWYRDNPDYAGYRKIIEKIGGNPQDVVNSEEFKEVFTKAKGFDETQKLRTVLESNPRIAAAKETFQKAKEAMETGNKAQGEQMIAQAVREHFKF